MNELMETSLSVVPFDQAFRPDQFGPKCGLARELPSRRNNDLRPATSAPHALMRSHLRFAGNLEPYLSS
jgi:hypothetical protein